MFNCKNCDYAKIVNDKIQCQRPLKTENRIAQVDSDKSELRCPCHSILDIRKEHGEWIDDGAFRVSEKVLLQIEKYIFG